MNTTQTPSLAVLKAQSMARADEIRKARAAEYRAAARAAEYRAAARARY